MMYTPQLHCSVYTRTSQYTKQLQWQSARHCNAYVTSLVVYILLYLSIIPPTVHQMHSNVLLCHLFLVLVLEYLRSITLMYCCAIYSWSWSWSISAQSLAKQTQPLSRLINGLSRLLLDHSYCKRENSLTKLNNSESVVILVVRLASSPK
jgi:hypothetical protein